MQDEDILPEGGQDNRPLQSAMRKPRANLIMDDKAKEEDQIGWKQKIYNFIESTPVIIFMMIVTIWALFGDDIRQVSVTTDGDMTFYILTLVCFGLFFIEVVLAFISKPDYRWGFFFWLDLVSTVSLLMDVQFISDPIMSGGSTQQSTSKNATSFAKTARASRIGTRAGRVVRIIRLIRLIRIVKLYKASQQAQEKQKNKSKKEIDKKKKSQFIKENEQPSNSNIKQLLPENGQDLNQENIHNSRRGSLAHIPQEAGKSNQVSAVNVHSEKNISDNQSRHEESMSRIGNDSKLATESNGVAEIEDIDETEVFQETKVGKKLSDLTTKRVIILILSIMISIPLFSTDTYFTDYTSYQSGIQNLLFLFNLNTNTDTNIPFQTAWKNFVDIHTRNTENVILKNISIWEAKPSDIPDVSLTAGVLSITNTTNMLKPSDLNLLRGYEKVSIVEPDYTNPGDFYIQADFEQAKQYDLNGYLGIGRTIFVCVVLTASAVFFSKDANELVLSPIEKMLSKVKRISKNPLTAVRVEEEYDIIWEDLKSGSDDKKSKDQDNFETTILEKTIVKIGALLALGFGEAGSQIIANNLHRNGEIDHMQPGKRVIAIFGFVDIKDFTVVTEVLQEGVGIYSHRLWYS